MIELINLYLMLLELHEKSGAVALDKIGKQVEVILELVEEVRFYVINAKNKLGNNVKGANNKVGGKGIQVDGSETLASGQNITISGDSNKVGGCNTVAACHNSTVVGNDTFAVGSNLTVKGNNTVVFSKNRAVNSSNTLVVEDYSLDIRNSSKAPLNVKKLN